MGDRNNPIKFGPEWLRNMSRERSMGRSSTNNNSANNQNTSSSSGTTMTSNSSIGAGSVANTTVTTTNSTGTTPKVLLAKLRYGREEMLALYDRNSDAPIELKSIDTLYQPRGKQPVALNNTFEDDMRENLRGPPPIGGISTGDRFGLGRGAGRGVTNDGRCRPRGSYIRSAVTGRGGHYVPKVGGPRMPYSGGADDDSGIIRPWTNNSINNRNSHDQTDWATKMFRSKRQGSNTNWRQQHSRDEGEEWRSSEPGRSRQVEKWDRDWGERPTGEKQQSWNTNRRTWVSGDSHNNEENLPEWAGENAECGGTFDSSGAFHGYSNDDTNIPKHQESSYSLTRSHTHGSFPRSKAIEEGSEEWWASEKAKKLSPKRFDASDLKFKKQAGMGVADVGNVPSTSNKVNTNKEETVQKSQDKRETGTPASEPPEDNASPQGDDKYNNPPPNVYKTKFAESKTFDALMRSDINVEEATDEKGNFQSVIIASNNSLRQKHQHIVMAPDGQKHIRISLKNPTEIDPAVNKSHEDLLVDNIFGMTLDHEEILSTSLSGMTMDMHVNKQNMQMSMQPGHPISNKQPSAMPSASIQKLPGLQMQSGGLQNPGVPSAGMQTSGLATNMSTVGMQNPGLPPGGMQTPGIMSGIQVPRVQTPGMQPVVQTVGITNSALNASLGLPIGPGPSMNVPLQGVPQQVMPNANNIGPSGMGVLSAASLQASNNMPSFPSNNGLPGMSGNNVGNNSLFLGQNTNNPPLMSSSNEMPMSNHGGQNNMYPLHGLQHSRSQASFGNSIYSNSGQNLDQWYYEDPERNIQGPFSSKDMYNWYRAGFFSPSLMVRRACDTMMRPLGSYGVVPFLQMDTMPGFTMPGGYESRSQGAHENILNSQPSLGLDVMNIGNMNVSNNTHVDNLQFGSVRLIAKQSFGQPQQMVESLWSQPSTSADLMWMQQPMPRSEARVNNLPIFFWDQQPTAIASNSSLLPEDVTKEMKTEDQILAQLRASQNIGQTGLQFIEESQAHTPPAATATDDCYPPMQNTTPNLEELHKLIQKDTLTGNASSNDQTDEIQVKSEKISKEQNVGEAITANKVVNKTSLDVKITKLIKDNEKSVKNKDNNNTKNKVKKSKEEKKDDVVEIKAKDGEVKAEKRSQESSPSKNKKDEKSNKKELEREKKEWIKDGFTLVKGSDKNATNKDTKKKAEEARIAEEAERKRREDEKLAAEEEKKKKLAESTKKQQEQQQQQQLRQASESLIKKAPWSAVATQAMQATNRDNPTLAEIQRLEREKKLEQIKEQQQMMHLIAQQQAAAYAREQEVQAGLGWAKKKANNMNAPGQSLAEIQAEARKQAAAASAAAAAQALEEAQAAIALAPVSINHVPWGNTHNGVGGFWESLLDQPQKQLKQENNPKPVDQIKPKKKQTLIIPPPKKEVSPALEFDNWCTGSLATWNSKIDVPTFIAFLKDIESPYEVKDYVKYYLGESKDSNDFARQFLEKRSKLLRVGTVTPSDDLCSPAIAVNPRTTSGSDYQEVKGKGKKTKKNKMLKVDARILGFSVTAAEDRINVGDIDTV